MNPKRFIEESFPVKEVGEISAKEKYIRHGHISTLHIWWARKPLAVSRAIDYTALTGMPTDPLEWQKKEILLLSFLNGKTQITNTYLNKPARKSLKQMVVTLLR